MSNTSTLIHPVEAIANLWIHLSKQSSALSFFGKCRINEFLSKIPQEIMEELVVQAFKQFPKNDDARFSTLCGMCWVTIIEMNDNKGVFPL